MKLIGITGTHGTGKTQAALYMAQRLKIDNPYLRIGLIMETAAECPLPINQAGSADSQTWLFAEQLRRELDALRHYDLIVCDRTPADVIAYTWCLGLEPLALAMTRMSRDHIAAHYQKMYFRTLLNNDWCVNDGRRDMDLDFRAAVESELTSTYRRLNLTERIQYV